MLNIVNVNMIQQQQVKLVKIRDILILLTVLAPCYIRLPRVELGLDFAG